MKNMIRKQIIVGSLLVVFSSYCDCKFSSLISLNDSKAKVTFVSMSKINGTRLVSNAILLNMSASHQSQCINKCKETTNCTSYNIFENSENMLQCQLLSENKYSNSNQLEKKNGWTHASFQSVPCERSPCKNNSPCVPDYTENSYFCICSENYFGPFCETELSTIISLPLKNLGCWKDKLNRIMPTLEGSSTFLKVSYKICANAIEMCYNAAEERGFEIFSIQDGGYCSVSNDDSYKIYGLSNNCNKNGKGGTITNQVYQIAKRLSYKYVGCWKDAAPHTLPLILFDDKTSLTLIKDCYVAANNGSYELFSVQAGHECHAGNAVPYQKYGASNTCNTAGTGAPYTNAVYIIKF